MQERRTELSKRRIDSCSINQYLSAVPHIA